MNPLGKLGNKIRLLTPGEQKYVIDNVQPEGVDISALTESIENFKQNELTLDFMHGLFDGDGGLSVYFVKPSGGSASNPSIGFSFTIVQDVHNLSLLDEIKSYFGDRGGVYKISEQCNIYKAGSKLDLKSVVLPKMSNKTPTDWGPYLEGAADLRAAPSGLKLPMLKYNKIYYSYKILELLGSSGRLNKENMNEAIALSYYIRQESDNITLEKYIGKVKESLL